MPSKQKLIPVLGAIIIRCVLNVANIMLFVYQPNKQTADRRIVKAPQICGILLLDKK